MVMAFSSIIIFLLANSTKQQNFSLPLTAIDRLLFRGPIVLTKNSHTYVGRDSVVGIAIRYGLDGPGIESRLRRDFRTRPERIWGSHSLLCNEHRVFPSGKVDGCGAEQLPTI